MIKLIRIISDCGKCVVKIPRFLCAEMNQASKCGRNQYYYHKYVTFKLVILLVV